MTNKLEMPLEQFAVATAKENGRLLERINQLTSGPGGIMEMKQTIADKETEIASWKGIHEGSVIAMQSEIDRLKKKCDLQTMMLRRLDAEKFPGTYFIHSSLGEKDFNGMPQKLLVVPGYGVDFSYIYERTEKTTGPEW